jgi:hypothetical protein
MSSVASMSSIASIPQPHLIADITVDRAAALNRQGDALFSRGEGQRVARVGLTMNSNASPGITGRRHSRRRVLL